MPYFNGHFVTTAIVLVFFLGLILGILLETIIKFDEAKEKKKEVDTKTAKLKNEHDEMYNALADIKLVYDRGGGGMQAVIDRAIKVYKKIRGV